MTSVFPSSMAAWLTPVKSVLAILVVTVLVALSSEETAASYQPPISPWIPFNPPPTPVNPTPLASTPPNLNQLPIVLTKVGSPIWKPTDFQLFTAPAGPTQAAFNGTLDLLLPLEGPGAPAYTPHAGPYDQELSTNTAAAGFVNKSVFPKSAILFNPNGVFLSYMLLPDPGVTGSSRDFASGPLIPNSLFPFNSLATMHLDGALVETLQDQSINIRAGDVGFTGASHRAPSQAVWYPWANDPNAGPLGSHEIRWRLTDNQGNGWNIAAPFQVTPEPSSLAMGAIGVMSVLAVGRRVTRRTR
jgi:hypothetical protein